LESLRLSVEQEVTISCGPHVFREMFTLAEKHEAGVAAREPNDVYRFFTVDLNQIKFNPPAANYWLGNSKPYSPEDQFMMSQAQPVTHGRIVKNEYFIAIRT